MKAIHLPDWAERLGTAALPDRQDGRFAITIRW
jgi:hypothetical protein